MRALGAFRSLSIKFIWSMFLLSHLGGVRLVSWYCHILLHPNITFSLHDSDSRNFIFQPILPQELSTSCCYCLASRVSARGKVMSFPYAGCCHNRVSYVMDVVSDCCCCCSKKNFKCSLMVTQDNCKHSLNVLSSSADTAFLGDCVNKKNLFL